VFNESLLHFDDVNHIYTYNGTVIPSVSELMKRAGLTTDYSMVNPDVLEKARRRGLRVHEITEILDRGDSPDLSIVERDIYDDVMRMVHAYGRFKSDYKPELIENEKRLVYFWEDADYPVYGGTMDRVFRIDGVEYTGDIKCTSTMPVSVGVQTEMYDRMRRGGGNLMALRLDKQGGYHVWSLIRSEDREESERLRNITHAISVLESFNQYSTAERRGLIRRRRKPE
jgi:hypothetical protein